MRGYGDLRYFKELDFIESLGCYICLVQDFENNLTLEKLSLMLKIVFDKEEITHQDHNEADNIVEEFF